MISLNLLVSVALNSIHLAIYAYEDLQITFCLRFDFIFVRFWEMGGKRFARWVVPGNLGRKNAYTSLTNSLLSHKSPKSKHKTQLKKNKQWGQLFTQIKSVPESQAPLD